MLLAIEAPWPLIAASTLLAGIGVELFSVFWDTSLRAHVPNEVLSRASAWDAMGSLVLIPAGYAIVGPLADAIGIDETLWLCAGIVLVRSRHSCSPARCVSYRGYGPNRRRSRPSLRDMLRAAMDREARVSLDAYRCLYPESDVTEIGGVTVLRSEAAPLSPMLNQIVGLGVDEPATEDVLDAALDAVGDDVTCYVAVAPEARPAELAEWLPRRGLEPGWGWMTFRRGLEPVPVREASLRLVRVGAAEADDFGRIVATGYDLPDAVATLTAQAWTLGWDCWLALDDDEPAAVAGLFAAEGVGYLGFAATLAEHRGKGGQNALLAARIEHAREIGCDVVITETGERRADLPSNSYRNILRAGFTENAVRANWLRPARRTR